MAGLLKILATIYALAGLLGAMLTIQGCEAYYGIRPIDSSQTIQNMTTSPWKCIFTDCNKELKANAK